MILFQPVFLTKEQRAAEALKKRQEEVEALRKKQEEERQRRNEFSKQGSSYAEGDRRERDYERERERERERDRDRERDRCVFISSNKIRPIIF